MNIQLNKFVAGTTNQFDVADTTFAGSQDCSGGFQPEPKLLLALAVFGTLVVITQRIWFSMELPLWLDETWTVTIASQTTWADFWHEAWLDCNPPLFYAFEKIWVSSFGTSNFIVRLPSVLFMTLAAVVPLVWKSHGLDKYATITWSILLMLWWPGQMLAVDARSYGMLFLASVCGTIAFIRVYRHLNWQSLLLWSTLATVQILTHYYSYFLVAAQGIALLWKWRISLIGKAYCLAPFVPAVAWTLYHLPRLADYARPDVVWYEPTNLHSALKYIIFSFGAPNPFFPLLLAIALGGALWKSNWERVQTKATTPSEMASSKAIQIACLMGVCALATIIMVSTFQASMTERYLVPLAPTMLLGVVALAKQIRRCDIAYLLLVAIYLVFALPPGPLQKELNKRSFYGYEVSSDFIAEARPTDLLFIWDHPAAKILDQNSLEQIGSFFLNRVGQKVRTTAPIIDEHDNPNEIILSNVMNTRTAILWVYDGQRRSAAAKFPPTLGKMSEWKCRDSRNYIWKENDQGKYTNRKLGVGILACIPSNQEASK